MIGKTISHYKILNKLGEGGMGVVYKAEDTKLKRDVALKFLPPQIAAHATERERFKIEAQAAAALNHSNIATIHAIEDEDDEIFIVMEYVEGIELKQMIAKGSLPVEESINIATQIAKGLQTAHKKEIVHRDIKSANIMITEGGQVKIMDFGLAKVRGSVQVTKVGTTVGTAAYMSPEQARGDELDHRTDIWSFGVVLYEMLALQLPYTGDYEQSVLYAIINENHKSISEFREDLPHSLLGVLNKSLEKELENRYQSINEVLLDLEEVKTEISRIIQPVNPEIKENKKSSGKGKLVGAITAVGLVLIMAIIVLVTDFSLRVNRSEPYQRKMIVVLPLENLGSPDDEYFSDGITEEITSRLASIPELAVIARTSAIQYKNTNKNIAQIGEELGVEYVLDGTVRWDKSLEGSSRIRVTPQLIRVSDATHLWSDRYDSVIDDIFSVQSEIAEQVIKQLDITLVESKRQIIREIPTENMEAYEAFLQGKEYLNHWDERHYRLAIQMFEQAILLDPNFVEAFSELSQAHSFIYHMGFDRSEERQTSARETVDKALKLKPNSPNAHLAMGNYHYWIYKAYDLAEQEFEEAEKYVPNNAELLAAKAFVQRRRGNWEKSIENLEKAIKLNPRYARWIVDQGFTFVILRKYQEAQSYFNRSIKLRSDYSFPYAWKCESIWLWTGDIKVAGESLQDQYPNDEISLLIWTLQKIYENQFDSAINILSALPGKVVNQVTLMRPKEFLKGWAYRLDNKEELALQAFENSRAYLEKRIRIEAEDFRLHAALGLTYAALGEKAEAIRFGRQAVDMYPVSKDVAQGSDVLLDLAWIYTMAGMQDEALEQIDYLLSIPSKISIHRLQIDPRWQSLRADSQYQKILSKYSDKIK